MHLVFRLTVLLCVLSFCWAGQGLRAQSAQLNFRQYTTDDGLPSSQNYVLFEDHAGYLWIGTDNGLARFDGYEFTVFDADDGLTDGVVFAIFEDPNHRIWMSTITGRLFYHDNGRIREYEYNHKLEQYSLGGNLIHVVEVSADGEVYLVQSPVGNKLVVSPSGEVTKTSRPGDCRVQVFEPTLPAHLERHHAAHNVSGRINSECSNVPIKFELGRPGAWRPAGTLTRSLRSVGYLNMPYATTWRAEGRTNLVYASNHQLTWVEDGKARTVSDPVVNDRAINFVLPQFKRGGFWLLENQGGGMVEHRFLPDGTYRKEPPQLPGHTPAFALYDRSGGLWVSTLDAGLFYAPFPEQQLYLKEDPRDNSAVTSILGVAEGNMYAGYDDGDIYRYRSSTGQYQRLNLATRPVQARCFDLFYDRPRERIYASGYSFTHRPDSLAIPVQREPQPVLYHMQRGSVYRQFVHNSVLWPDTLYGCGNNTSVILDLTDPHTREPTRADPYQQEDRIRFIGSLTLSPDHRNRLIASTMHGVLEVYSPDSATAFRPDLPALRGRVERFLPLGDSATVYGTRGAGIVYVTDDTTVVIRESHGLASDMIRDVHQDEQGQLWVATLDGLSRIIPYRDGSYRLRTFRTENGLPTNEIHAVGSYGDEIWLATGVGATRFVVPPLDTSSPPPVMRQLIVDGVNYPPESPLALKAGVHDVQVSFSTINFILGNRVRYRYRTGPEQEWQYTTERTANFPNLKAGEYQFSVQSQNQDGYWSAASTVRLTIATPWYQRWWAVAGGLLLVIGAVATIFSLRERRRRREQDLLLQINELEHAALHAQMNPHFVFNALNSIQNFVLQNDARQAATYLSRFARVIRQTLRSSVEGKHSLVREIEMLSTYLVLEKLRFKDGFDYTLTTDPSLPLSSIILPPLLIQPFIENAIVHGLKDRKVGGRISVHFAGTPDLLEVTIEDNGIGYDPTASRKADSMGMSITKRRLLMMRGDENADAAMRIEPLHDASGGVRGTRVVLFVQPLRSKPRAVATSTT